MVWFFIVTLLFAGRSPAGFDELLTGSTMEPDLSAEIRELFNSQVSTYFGDPGWQFVGIGSRTARMYLT
jgi:hypothetical protein